METSRYYRVAGHSFCVKADTAWLDKMNNYAPFATECKMQNAELCFSLNSELTNSLPTLDGYKLLFVDSSDDDMPRLEVSQSEQGNWLIAMAMFRHSEVMACLQLSADFKNATLYATTPNKWAIDNALMLQYAFVTASLGTLEMHAAVVKKDDKAYIFLGKSGTGKSTHARQWLKVFADAQLLNDDNPILRVADNQVTVYGSPWSGKTPCYKNDSASVEAIYLLHQAPKNVLRPLTMPEAYAAMLMSVSGMKIMKNTMDNLYETIVQVIQTAKMYYMDCLPNEDAACVAAKG
ncbi:MAG: hypothetical protein MJZ88_04355 [Paludibacteraceae bacterium]|nr:hypothetical protein [Paludibacteraceae bacterium]